MAINLEKRNISFIYLHHRSPSMTTEEKDIYAIGEIPPLGYMPKKMHAWVIRRDRHGNPMQSFKEEEFDIPEVGSNDVLIFVTVSYTHLTLPTTWLV